MLLDISETRDDTEISSAVLIIPRYVAIQVYQMQTLPHNVNITIKACKIIIKIKATRSIWPFWQSWHVLLSMVSVVCRNQM